jgi:hypothetical protein
VFACGYPAVPSPSTETDNGRKANMEAP